MNEQEFFNYAQIEEINENLARENALVTIWCPTYNHGKYIKDTLDGFVSQETDFDFQVLIYDDGSEDCAAEIIREYAHKYFNRIHAFLAKRNTYQHPDRFLFTKKLKKANFVGKYIAICEGDDCWIDPHKLQIQVDYMERHPNCSLYMHNALRIDYRENMSFVTNNSYQCMEEKDLNGEEIIMLYRQHPATASMLYKKELYFMPDLFEKVPFNDYSTQLFCMINGDVHYSSRIMSIYRFFTEESNTKKIFNDKNSRLRFYILQAIFLAKFDQYTSLKYHEWIDRRMQGCVLSIVDDLHDGLEEHINELVQQGMQIADADWDIVNRIIALDKQIKNLQFLRDELIEFMNTFQNIVVMGIGNYSNKLSEQLKINGIDFCGYAVSKLDKCCEFRGKKVWQLDQINKEFSDVGVVVAIKPLKWNELTESLANAGIKNYYCPFRV